MAKLPLRSLSRLVALVGLAMALALAVQGSTDATSLNEVKKLTASDAQADDRFCLGIAVSGDTAAVGACLRDGGGVPNAGARSAPGRGRGRR